MNSLTSSKIGSQSLRVLGIVRTTLKLEDADVIRINRLGEVVTPLPEGLTAQDIDVAAVQAGQTTSGRNGQHGLRGGSRHALASRSSPSCRSDPHRSPPSRARSPSF